MTIESTTLLDHQALAEEFGNRDLWLATRDPMHRWWLERYTMKDIRVMARALPEKLET